MSERIYRLLLRLYPGRFRRSYAGEALQLFRDRLQDETGFLRRSRLWLELVIDLGALHVRGYHEAVVVRAAAAERGPGGVPSFASVEGQALEFRFLFWGGVFSLILCGSALFALQYRGGHLHPVYGASDPNAVLAAKMPPKIVFSYEPIGSPEGKMVRMHAVVSASDGGPMPTGKVNFLHGWNIFVGGTLVNGSVTVDAKVPKGKKLPLNALYLGDSNYGSTTSVEKAR